MGHLVLGTVIGLLIGLPQLLPALCYWPQSVRSQPHRSLSGRVPLAFLFKGCLMPRTCDRVNGLFFPEVCVFTGWLPLLSAWYAPWSHWHGILLLGILGATGRWMPRGFRLPARFCWLISISLVFLSLHGLPYLPVSKEVLILLVILQVASLMWASWNLLPMEPFCQQWERPSAVFNTALTRWLSSHATGNRVSGLPYPLRTGHINRIRTLGYNGGSRSLWMAQLRPQEGGHDWFEHGRDGKKLDAYGITYAYTYRHLKRPKWLPTPMAHLFRNVHDA